MRVGYVVGSSTPLEFLATLDPDIPVSIYEYVAVEHTDVDLTPVRLLGQVVKLYRDPYSVKRDLPLYSVMSDVSNNVIEVAVARVKILGYLDNGVLRQPKLPPKIGATVYFADDGEVAELFKVSEGLCVGKSVARGVDICLNLNGIQRHMAIIAATGSGKTWLSVVLIEELLKKGGKIVVIDPHGEYTPIRDSIHRLGSYQAKVVIVSKRYSGDVMYRVGVLDSDAEALANAAGVPPGAKKIRDVIRLSWLVARKFHRATGKPVGLKFMYTLLKKTAGGNLQKFLKQLSQKYGVDLASGETSSEELSELAGDRYTIFRSLMYIKRLMRLGVFAARSTSLAKVLADVSIVNLAGVNEEIQDYIVARLLDRIFQARVREVRSLKGEKLPWPLVVVVEEAHRFAPPKTQRRTRSYEALARVASEGRKFGVFLVVISQRPSRVDQDILSQCQSQIIMRVINQKDQIAIRDSSELLAQEFLENLPGLDVGEAVVLGPVINLPTVIKVRDRVLDYGGSDIDLAEAWQAGRQVDLTTLVYTKWRQFFNSTPPPSIPLSASKLRVVEKKPSTNGVVEVVLADGSGHVTVTIANDGVTCSACGAMKPCPHVYKALEEVIRAKVVVA